MTERLTCEPSSSTHRPHAHEPDEPSQCSDLEAVASRAAPQVTAASQRGSGTRQQVSAPPFAAPTSPSSRALAAKFASPPVLLLPSEAGSQCVSVGELHLTAPAARSAPPQSAVGIEDHVALESRPIIDSGQAHDLTHGVRAARGDAETVAAPPQRHPRRLEAPAGPSYEETKRDQRVGLFDGCASLTTSTTVELAGEMLTLTRMAPLGGMLSPMAMLYSLHQLYVRAHEEGAAQGQALDRDAANLAVVLVGSRALPQSYVEAEVHEYRASRFGAERILTTESRDPTGYEALTRDVEHDVRRGREMARTGGLDSQNTLDERLATDARFRDDFTTNAGFRHGVRAEVMLSERGHRN